MARARIKRSIRELGIDDVQFTITVEPETDVPVRGNAISTGDDGEDRAVEDAIIARLERGDVWAWASVRVRAAWRSYAADVYLGCCSYDGIEDFSAPDGYLPQLKRDALADLNDHIARIEADVKAVRSGKARASGGTPAADSPA